MAQIKRFWGVHFLGLELLLSIAIGIGFWIWVLHFSGAKIVDTILRPLTKITFTKETGRVILFRWSP
jgi:hypothetical protein